MLIKYSSLKQKDLDYMNFILKNGMVTAKQVYLNFEEKNLDTVYRRLRKLKDNGYIKHHKIAHKVGVYIGTKEARNATEAKVTVPEAPSIYTIRHSLLMTDLILYNQLTARKNGRSFSYQSEREIRYEALQNTTAGKPMIAKMNEIKERIPDCMFLTQTKEGKQLKIWVELELHQKDNKRYDEKFKERFDPALASGEYTNVWYFSDAQRIRNAVEKAKEKLMNGNKIRVFDIPEVIKNDTWEEVLPNGSATTNGESEGEGGIGPGN